jgi:hypothetical protein
MRVTTMFAAAAVMLAAVVPTVVSAVPPPHDYAAVARANEKDRKSIAYRNAHCAPGNEAACARANAKTEKAIDDRIKTYSRDPSLTPANQRATERQLREIDERNKNCTNQKACDAQNKKTLGSINYRINNQPPVSPA